LMIVTWKIIMHPKLVKSIFWLSFSEHIMRINLKNKVLASNLLRIVLSS